MVKELETSDLPDLLARVAARDPAARNELLRRAARNLERLARKMMADYPGVRRWEETADVVQNASVRLLRALEQVTPENTRRLFGLAAEQIRRELLDLARRYYGPEGIGRNQRSHGGDLPDPPAAGTASDGLADWQALHEGVACLAAADRQVFDLLFYQDLSQADAAEILGISVPAIQQRWQRARLRLHDLIQSRRTAG
jgi:RNA polymerase sigma factor (sigma-70 family)